MACTERGMKGERGTSISDWIFIPILSLHSEKRNRGQKRKWLKGFPFFSLHSESSRKSLEIWRHIASTPTLPSDCNMDPYISFPFPSKSKHPLSRWSPLSPIGIMEFHFDFEIFRTFEMGMFEETIMTVNEHEIRGLKVLLSIRSSDCKNLKRCQLNIIYAQVANRPPFKSLFAKIFNKTNFFRIKMRLRE